MQCFINNSISMTCKIITKKYTKKSKSCLNSWLIKRVNSNEFKLKIYIYIFTIIYCNTLKRFKKNNLAYGINVIGINKQNYILNNRYYNFLLFSCGNVSWKYLIKMFRNEMKLRFISNPLTASFIFRSTF